MESSKIKLRYRDRNLLFKKEYSELKIKVALNWFEIITLIVVVFLVSLKLSFYLNLESLVGSIIISFISTIIITSLFCYFRKYQLKITRFDKEHIYKKISNELIEKSKE